MLTALQVPEVTGYFNLIHSQEFPQTFAYDHPRLFTSPLYMNLREHHCVNPETPAASGGEPEGFDDGICNAWFPVDTTFYEEREKGELRVVHTDSGTDSCYTTWVPGRPNGHSEDTCTLCERRREDHEMEVVARARIFARTAEHVDAAREAADEEEPEERPREEVGSDPPSPPEDPMDQVVAARQAATEALGTDADEVLREVVEESSDEDMDSEEDEYASTNEDDVEEYIEAECTGVSDIVITGEVRPSSHPHNVLHLRCLAADAFLTTISPADAPEARRSVESLPLLRTRAGMGRPHRAGARPHVRARSRHVHLSRVHYRRDQLRRALARLDKDSGSCTARGAVHDDPCAGSMNVRSNIPAYSAHGRRSAQSCVHRRTRTRAVVRFWCWCLFPVCFCAFGHTNTMARPPSASAWFRARLSLELSGYHVCFPRITSGRTSISTSYCSRYGWLARFTRRSQLMYQDTCAHIADSGPEDIPALC